MFLIILFVGGFVYIVGEPVLVSVMLVLNSPASVCVLQAACCTR